MNATNECPMCEAHGKTWNGDDRKCAFKGGVFTSDNWKCATVSVLRRLAEENAIRTNDQWCGTIPFEDKFIIVGWYKSRGRTEAIWVMDEETMHPITLKEAEEVIEYYKGK